MGLFDKAKEAAEKAKQAGQEAAEKAKEAGHEAAEKAKELVSPEKLAEMITNALATQEKVNQALEAKGSRYTIGELTIELGLPPSISFTITRKG